MNFFFFFDIENFPLFNISYHLKPFHGGYDTDGQDLYICRTKQSGIIIPGKYSQAIGKCSIAMNHAEMQFKKFELLIEDDDTKYEWIKLKKPVTSLPDNVLFVGVQNFYHNFKENEEKSIQKRNYQHLDHVLSNSFLNGKMKRTRRLRRNTNEDIDNENVNDSYYWSKNWRQKIPKTKEFIELPIIDKDCLEKSLSITKKCIKEEQKLNYFIARCTLRTGNKLSEQIGKIWWKNSIQEWIASFSFGGHEIYCLDYSVLTLKKMN